MNPIERLNQINDSFSRLLAEPEKAGISASHESDELMVWFLFGGKDVGKSTFLNSLLGMRVSEEPPEQAEGTRRFVAYIHRSQQDRLRARLGDLPIGIRFHPHESEAHRRLCLIDGPDFDSRFERHASQVRQVLRAGVADGAVLLASPAKYKDLHYWDVFQSLSGAISPRHILFTLTKADELGEFLDKVRSDFADTVARRMVSWGGGDGDRLEPGRARVYLINSLDRTIDFKRLESRLMRKLSTGDVRSAQQENLRHALTRGAERIREHYGLDEIRKALTDSGDPGRVQEIFEEHFPETYFAAVASRLTRHRALAAAVRDRLRTQPDPTLAGIPTMLAAVRWLGSLLPSWMRSEDSPRSGYAEDLDLDKLMRWGQENLGQRLSLARREVLAGLRLDRPEALESYGTDENSVTEDLVQLLDDHLAQPVRRAVSGPLRLLLNIPVYMYLLFFIFLLLYPVFLFLQAWDVLHAPDVAGILTLDNVKVSVIGFLGYYIMAVLFVIRKHRDRARREAEAVCVRFLADAREVIREGMQRPLARFAEAFSRLEENLDRCAGWVGGSTAPCDDDLTGQAQIEQGPDPEDGSGEQTESRG